MFQNVQNIKNVQNSWKIPWIAQILTIVGTIGRIDGNFVVKKTRKNERTNETNKSFSNIFRCLFDSFLFLSIYFCMWLYF